MVLVVLLSVAASVCTAASSVCQRLGASNLAVSGFDPWLVFRLARQPVWLLGFVSMLGGFALQVAALHFGALALVQPILATELLFVFIYLAISSARRLARRVQARDWLAAVGMSGGMCLFLGAAAPSGGQTYAPASLWWLAGLVTGGCVLLAVIAATRLSAPAPGTSSGRERAVRWAVHRAAILGIATGIAWGFVAAVIKELSSHLGQGLGAIFTNWAVYVLMATGAAALVLVSHAMAAGPLAASQPGFTIGDPVTAALLGVLLFGESIRTGAGALAAQLAGLVILVVGVAALSHSRLITGEEHAGSPRHVDRHISHLGGFAVPREGKRLHQVTTRADAVVSELMMSLTPGGQPRSLRKALVTGGSSGIGAATARAFAARGFEVVIAGRDLSALKEVAADTGGPLVRGDLREPGVPQRIVQEAAEAIGGLDVVVSNAGVGWAGSFASMTDEEINSVLDVNLRAGAHLTRAALQYLRAGAGHLVFTGSIAGLVGVPDEAWYSATKAGLGTFASALRSELRPVGIRVTLVSPGVVDTAYFDRRAAPYTRHHPRPISAQVVADAIVDAVERRRDEIVLPGWLSWPARLKVNFPSLYRLLESRFA